MGVVLVVSKGVRRVFVCPVVIVQIDVNMV